MQYKIENDYIFIKNENLNIGETYVLKSCGMSLDEKANLWKGKDDALKRAMLGIPLEDRRINKVEEVTFPPLYPFQREDVKTMVELGNCLNANKMGLGKTLETIVALNLLQCERVLIICPKSVKTNWKKELKKWMNIPSHLVNIISGTPKQRARQLENLDVPFVIINYEQVRTTKTPKNKIENNDTLIALQKVKWDAIVCDEAHRIKNAKAKQTLGVKSLKSKYRIALTGTPIQNKPDDLWSILHWIDPYYSGGSYWRFVELFCETFDNGYGLQIVGLTKDKMRQQALHDILQTVMIRRENDKSLPDYMHIPIEIRMPDKQDKLYEKIKKEILVELEGLESTLFINNSLTRLLRLQQCTSNPEIFGIKENPKFDFIMDILEDSGDDKLVIYSRFKQTIDALANRLSKERIKYSILTSDTKDRQEAIDTFINNPEVRCFIATIGAAGEGIDGLQYASDKMIFIDKEWSPAKNNQAESRLIRNGQKNSVKIYELICPGTIDFYVDKLLNKKVSDIIKLLSSS